MARKSSIDLHGQSDLKYNEYLWGKQMPDWLDYMKDRVEGRETGLPWYLHDKLKCYRYLESAGIATAKVLREFDNPGEIDLSGLDGDFVLKPTLQSSTKGVMVLSVDGDGYFDNLRQRYLNLEQIVLEQTEYFNETHAVDKKIIVEEKIADLSGHEVPRDFKAYAFRGELALILEIDRNTKPSTVSWFDGEFRPIEDERVSSNKEFVNPVKATVPESASELARIAQEASALIPTPFASIDMYSTREGPLVGEITLAPGALYHGKHFSLSRGQQFLMGKMWEDAIGDIAVRKNEIAVREFEAPYRSCTMEQRKRVDWSFLSML